jgi:hypothetical protein
MSEEKADWGFVGEILKTNTVSDLVFGLFLKIFEIPNKKDEITLNFPPFFSSMIKENSLNISEVVEGLNRYHEELINLECDYPFMPDWYSTLMIHLIDGLDFPFASL